MTGEHELAAVVRDTPVEDRREMWSAVVKLYGPSHASYIWMLAFGVEDGEAQT